MATVTDEQMRDTEEGIRVYLEAGIQEALGRRCWLNDVRVEEKVELVDVGDPPGRITTQKHTELTLTVKVGGPL